MRRRTAAILSFYSERSRGSSRRHVLARAAWRALAAAAGRGDANAIEAIWQAWLRHPDDERWELLTRWRGGAEALAEAVFAAAVDPARPAASRAALGAFCASRGLAPAGDPERARFYLLTGQPAQHRAADPDGSALAAAYRAADEQVRAALRQAMADLGGLDLVRVIAAGSIDAARIADTAQATDAERAYLTAELARRQDWPRLWRLALDLPLAQAVAAARRLPDGWRPGGEAGRQLLARLAAASEAEIAALATPTVTRVDAGNAAPYDCRFSPDGSEIAVAWVRQDDRHGVKGLRTHEETVLHALPDGRELEVFLEANVYPSGYPPSPFGTLHFGAGAVFANRTYGSGGGVFFNRRYHPGTAGLMRYVRGHGLDELTDYDIGDSAPILAAVPSGFVVAVRGRLLHGTAEPGSPLRDVTPSGLRVDGRGSKIIHVAGEPRTGRVAVVIARPEPVPDGVAVLSPDFEIIGHADVPGARGPYMQHIEFCGPGRLITCYGRTGRLLSWQTDPLLPADAATVFPESYPRRIEPLPSAGLIVIESVESVDQAGTRLTSRYLDWVHTDRGFRREYLDAVTLRPAECPAALRWTLALDGGTGLCELYLPPEGGHIAALFRRVEGRTGWSARVLELCDQVREEIRELALRPLARSRPADLAAVTDLAARAAGSDALAVLGLLRACLEYRFGDEVALGEGRQPLPGADDIALAAGD